LFTDHLQIEQHWLDHIADTKWEVLSNNHGQLSSDKNILSLEGLQDLRKMLMIKVYEFTRSILHIDSRIDWQITTSWAVRHKPNDIAVNHFHTNSIFSGVLFLEIPPNSGILRFRKHPTQPMVTTSTITLDIEPYNDLNMANMQHWDVYCKPGKLVMFPSHLYHSVTKNASDQDRLTLAFNLWPKGPLGSAGLDKIIFP
jgi:uncharacterized protein (TIGR02466 family)